MAIAEATRVLTRASEEWWKRPDDERYLTLDHLYASTLARAEASEARTIVNDSLLVRGSAEAGGELYLEHDALGTLDPTHWSLGQLATISHTPAKWIREVAPVPTGPAIAAHAINLGLRRLAKRAEVQVMKLPTSPASTRGALRCIVGPEYGRIYDHEVVKANPGKALSPGDLSMTPLGRSNARFANYLCLATLASCSPYRYA